MDRLIDVTKLRLPCKGDNSKCIKGGAAKYDCFNCNREITASAQDAKTAHLVAQEIFKELEEQFGLYSDGENGQLELDMIVIKPGDYYSSEDAMEKYKAFKTKWGVKE